MPDLKVQVHVKLSRRDLNEKVPRCISDLFDLNPVVAKDQLRILRVCRNIGMSMMSTNKDIRYTYDGWECDYNPKDGTAKIAAFYWFWTCDRSVMMRVAGELAPLARKHINCEHSFETYWDEFGRLGVS
jgi:hypothetical protein